MTELRLRKFIVSFIYPPSLLQSSTEHWEQFNCNFASQDTDLSIACLTVKVILQSLANTTTALSDSMGRKNYKFTYLLSIPNC